ncbi:SDR family NAD(P)-dependent oxidoreductase [Parabacteroides sp. APC149_11_2_Y6]
MDKPVVLVTGSSSGIGRVIAIELSKEYTVILHGRNQARLVETQQMCFNGAECLIWNENLADIYSLEERLQAFLCDHNIQINSFVHCAGIINMLPLKSQHVQNIIDALNINLVSAMLITKVLSSKKWNKGALDNIVYISSNISNRGAKAFNSYAATKGALDAFMRSVAVELAPKVRVNSVLPGAVLTEMTSSIFENKEVEERMESTYPLGYGFPQDIANGVKFLLSGQARWITGQQLTIDGGRTINITG